MGIILAEAAGSDDINYRDIYNSIAKATNNFTTSSGNFRYETNFEANLAKEILSSNYSNVYIKPLDMNKEYDIFYTVLYSKPRKGIEEKYKDLDFQDNKNPAGTPLGDGTGFGESINNDLIEKIVKVGSKYQVQSEKGRNMGTYDTKKEAEERLRQVEYFKHKNESLVESDANNVFDSELVKDEIRNQLTDALKKKYKNLVIDFDDEYDDGSHFRVNVELYNKWEFLAGRYFSVNYNEPYFDLVGDVSSFVNKIKYQINHPDYVVENLLDLACGYDEDDDLLTEEVGFDSPYKCALEIDLSKDISKEIVDKFDMVKIIDQEKHEPQVADDVPGAVGYEFYWYFESDGEPEVADYSEEIEWLKNQPGVEWFHFENLEDEVEWWPGMDESLTEARIPTFKKADRVKDGHKFTVELFKDLNSEPEYKRFDSEEEARKFADEASNSGEYHSLQIMNSDSVGGGWCIDNWSKTKGWNSTLNEDRKSDIESTLLDGEPDFAEYMRDTYGIDIYDDEIADNPDVEDYYLSDYENYLDHLYDLDDDSYDADHAAEWMERNPYGYYNNEGDYGVDVEDGELDIDYKKDDADPEQFLDAYELRRDMSDEEAKAQIKKVFDDDLADGMIGQEDYARGIKEVYDYWKKLHDINETLADQNGRSNLREATKELSDEELCDAVAKVAKEMRTGTGESWCDLDQLLNALDGQGIYADWSDIDYIMKYRDCGLDSTNVGGVQIFFPHGFVDRLDLEHISKELGLGESLNEAKFSSANSNDDVRLVKASYDHFMNDLGEIPSPDDILYDILDNYNQDIFQGGGPMVEGKEIEAIKSILRSQGLEYRGDLDESKNDTLNQDIWDENNELRPEVKEKLELIVKKFTEALNEDNVNLDIKDIEIVGSNANYNYTDKSDIDLHIIADLSIYKDREDLAEIIYNAYRRIFNDKFDPMIRGHEVEIYVEPFEDENENKIPDEAEQVDE